MSQNTLLGVLLMAVGASDIVVARLLGDRLNMHETARTLLTFSGFAFLALGAIVALGHLRFL
jgi:hypothetical protein